MKRKYFFGILLSLFLLCGGVFFLTANSFSNFNENQNLDNENITNAVTINLNITAYGDNGHIGADIKMIHQLCNQDGDGNFQSPKELTISRYANSPYTDNTSSHDNSPIRRGRMIIFDTVRLANGLSNATIVCRGETKTLTDGTAFYRDMGLFNMGADAYFYCTIYYDVTLTLNANQGSGGSTSCVYDTESGSLTSSITVPTRTGYTFQGFYQGSTQIINSVGAWTEAWDRTTVRPTVLVAHWTQKDYQIDTNILSPSGAQDYNSGTMIQSYNGQTSKVTTDQVYSSIKADTTLTIKDINPATGMYVSSITVDRGKVSTTISNKLITGCTYTPRPSTLGEPSGGWDAIISINMAWLIYKVRYNANGGSGTMTDQSFTYNTAQNLKSNTFTRAGYYFTGWNGNGTNYTNGQSVINLTTTHNSTIDFYAQWKAYVFTYSFDTDGGSTHAGGTANYGSNITLPTPSKTGYTFKGWHHSINGNTYQAGNYSVNDIANSDATVVFTAIWQPYEYEVVFNKNSNQAVGSMNNQSFTYDTAQNLSTNQFTRAGYNFLGWSRSSNATTAEYQDKVSVKNLITTNNGIVTLYAIWGINQSSLIINLDGGKFETNLINNSYTQSLESYQMTFLETPIKAGYIFAGWEISGNATIELAQYYLSSKEFNGTSDYQAIGREYMYTDKLTINLFGYMDDWSSYAPDQRLISCTESGGWDLAFHNSEYICAEFYQQNVGYTNVKLNTKWSSVESGWHMFTMVFDKDYAYLYIDGELSGKSVKFTNGLQYNSTNGVFIGAEAGSSMTTPVGQYFKGSIQNVMLTHGYISGIKDIYSQTFSTSNNLNNNYVLIMGSESSTIKAKWISTEVIDNSRENEINQKFNQSYKISISSEQDLYDLLYYSERNEIGSGYSFIQTTNLTLTKTWLPIGRLESFTATYDGQGYTIKGINTDNTITNKNGEYLERYGGLFANASGATIKNLIIEGANIYGQNAGIIAGSGNSSTNISNCLVSGTVNGTKIGSIVGNGNGCQISVCLAKEVNIANFAGDSANIDSCIYELSNGTRGASDSFNNYSAWIYPFNFAYPMPKAFMWYPYPELSEDSLNTWINR